VTDDLTKRLDAVVPTLRGKTALVGMLKPGPPYTSYRKRIMENGVQSEIREAVPHVNGLVVVLLQKSFDKQIVKHGPHRGQCTAMRGASTDSYYYWLSVFDFEEQTLRFYQPTMKRLN